MNTKLIYCIPVLLFQSLYITLSDALQNCVERSKIRIDARRYSESTQSKSFSRKHFLLNNIAIFNVGIFTPVAFSKNSAVNAKSIPVKEISPRETSVGEALRRTAANIPGYGPTDVFYPLNWQGTWTLRREDILTNRTIPETFIYPVRFIQSVDKDTVIADRTFNERNFWETVHKGDRIGNVVQSIQWTETNPNDLNILFTNGFKRNVKVTKRASELTNTTVSSSEFQRISSVYPLASVVSYLVLSILSLRFRWLR